MYSEGGDLYSPFIGLTEIHLSSFESSSEEYSLYWKVGLH